MTVIFVSCETSDIRRHAGDICFFGTGDIFSFGKSEGRLRLIPLALYSARAFGTLLMVRYDLYAGAGTAPLRLL